MAILPAIIDSDKNKLYQVIKGVPQFDMGNTITLPNSKLKLDKYSNGYNYRYRAQYGQVLNPTGIFNTTVDNSITTSQPIYEFIIPAGTINVGDVVELSFTQTGNAVTPFTLSAVLTAAYDYVNVTGQMYRNTGLGGNFVISFSSIEAGISNITSSSFAFTSDGGKRIINTLSDIKVTISGKFTNSVVPATSSVTYSLPKLTFKPSQTASYTANMGLYRKPDETPFHEDSFWNRQLASTCTYGSSSHPMALLLKDVRAGQTDKVNGTRKNIRWIEGPGINGSNVPYQGGIPVYYCSDSDPVCDVRVNSTNIPRRCGPWFLGIPMFIETINGVNYGSLKIKMPGNKLFAGQSSDRIVILISPDKRYALEVGVYVYDDIKKQHTFGYAHIHDLYGYGHSMRYWPRLSNTQITSSLSQTTYGFQFGYRAGGLPSFAGLIKSSEIANGVIPHMIGMQLDPILLRTSRVAVVSWDTQAKTFTIKPRTPNTQTMDYSSLFVAGLIVVHQSITYTCTGFATWDSGTNLTTFGVNEIITNPVVSSTPATETGTSNATHMFLGGNLGTGPYFDYRKLWPLGECDGASDFKDGYNGIIPLGQVFAIPKNLDLSTLGLTSSYSLMVAQAFKDYGGILDDITGNTFNVIQLESATPNNIRGFIFADLDKIVNALVPVLNYGPSTVQDSINDVTLTKLLPLVPIYN